MSLVDHERDDAALLAAEDEAIAEAAKGEAPTQTIPIGDELARLIEDLTHGPATVYREG